MAASRANRHFSVLIINPNTSTHMTDALKPIVESLNYTDVHFDYFTAPKESITLPDGRVIDGVPSINSGEDSVTSALHCKPFVESFVSKYDAFLVACYSAHPLVGILKDAIAALDQETKKYVTGIFEASVLMSLSLISSFNLSGGSGLGKEQAKDTFGIVTTGSIWKDELSKAVAELLVNPDDSHNLTSRFAGVETTGLTAAQLHTTSAEEVRKRISDATVRLIKSVSHPLSSICMGCAGMAGMEEAVRAGCIEVYGEQQGRRVKIVDGVVAGAGMLVTACKAGF